MMIWHPTQNRACANVRLSSNFTGMAKQGVAACETLLPNKNQWQQV